MANNAGWLWWAKTGALILLPIAILLVLFLAIPLGIPTSKSIMATSPTPPPASPAQESLPWFPIARGNRENWFTPATLPPFGFETNTGRITNTQVFAYAQQLGATWIRINTVSWLAVQPEPDRIYHWDAMAKFEQEILAAKQAGLIPIVVVDDYPAWATKPYWNEETQSYAHARCGPIDEAYFSDYAAFLGELVRRYSKLPYAVRYWELGNEPDVDPRLLTEYLHSFFGCWGDIDDPYYGGRHYGAMLQAVVPTMREADPNALILSGGLALDRPETTDPELGKPERFFEGILLSGAADMFDIVGFHVYVWYQEVIDSDSQEIVHDRAIAGETDPMRLLPPAPTSTVRIQMDPDHQDERWKAWGGATAGKVRYLQALLKKYGVEEDRPFFLNETGLVGYPPHDERFFEAQADHLVRQLTVAMSVGVQSYIWYTLHESGWLSAGLLDRNYQPRAPYQAYQHFIRQVRGSNLLPIALSSYGEHVAAYRFAGPDGFVDVVWSTQIVSQTITTPLLTMRQVIGRDGNAFPYEVQGDNARIKIGMSPVYIRSAYPPPHINSVTPTESYPGTPIRISGSGFMTGAQVTLCHRPLEQVTIRDTQTIHAVVPPGLSPATCPIEITNIDGQVNTLPLAHTILTTTPPRIAAIQPNRWALSRADLYLPSVPVYTTQMLNIYGENFSPSPWLGATLGTTPLTPTRISSTHLQAPLLPSDLLPGTHPLTLTTSEGHHITIPDAYTLYHPDDDDMTGYAISYALDPITPRVGQPVHIQIPIYRYGGNTPHLQVPVRFTIERWPDDAHTNDVGLDNRDQRDEGMIREYTSTIPLLRPNGSQTVTTTWIPQYAGTYTLTATIDPEQTFSETITTNNQISRTVAVRSSWFAGIPPEITTVTMTSLRYQERMIATTTQPTVSLALEIPELKGSSSSVLVLLVEYGYAKDTHGNERWLPVQQSGWLTHTAATTYTWKLTPMPGEKHIQVWAATRSGDVGFSPAHARIAYLPEGSNPLVPNAETTPGRLWALPPAPSFPSHPIYLPLLWR